MSPLSHDIAWTLAHFLWQGTAIALAAKVCFVLIDRRSAGLRQTIGLLALAAMATAAIGPFAHLRSSDPKPYPLANAPVLPVANDPVNVPAASAGDDAATEEEFALVESVAAKVRAAASSWPFDWKRGVVVVWVAGVAMLSAWRLIGLLGIARLRWRSRPAPMALVETFIKVRGTMHMTSRAVVRLSDLARVPMVVGALRPIVLLPAAAVAGLTPEQLRVILAHELAHVRRHDFLVNLLQTAVETLLFFHPGVWWLGATVRREREYACDDIAVEFCDDDRGLVGRALGHLAQLAAGKTASSLAMAAGRKGEFARRIARLLNPGPRQRASAGIPGALFFGFVVVAVLFRQPESAIAAPRETEVEQATADPEQAEFAVERDGRILDRSGMVLAQTKKGLRQYPYGALAAHVVGYAHAGIGRDGVELSADQHLRSRDLSLTLDLQKQFVVEQILRAKGIGRGAVVIVEPGTGDIIAMASVPSFDAGDFAVGITREKFETLRDDPASPLSNRGLAAYPPASTFKVVSAFILPKPDIRYGDGCAGSIKTHDGVHLKCWKATGHGRIALPEAITQSCNCYFYQLAGYGIVTLHANARQFGLGEPTGIELPNESPTRVPDDDFIDAMGLKSGFVERAMIAIGQGHVTASPLQLAVVAATIATGERHPPRLFLDRKRAAPVAFRDGVPGTVYGAVRDAMRSVVNAPEGTGRRASSDAIAIAGKTGTSQRVARGQRELVGHFIGFAPFDEPRYAIAVTVEGAKSGGTVCAPLAKQILERFAEIDAGEKIEVTPLAPAKGHSDLVGEIAL